jgi:2-succinyl-5-enolpyruvyl-6-hydroxy-3-cyclohexene-1-carboxylate synthase
MSVAVQQCTWAKDLLWNLCRRGLTKVIIAPGSRHTPLILAAHNLALESHLEIFDVLDERVAGFVGLGLARVTGMPVAILTTSGSAGAHLLPAVIEAERSRVPLIVITADRPEALHGVGAPQTIVQRELYGVHARESFEVQPLGLTHPAPEVAARAMEAALGLEPGPVHLNIPFQKPLWEPGSDVSHSEVNLEPCPIHVPSNTLEESSLDALSKSLQETERGLIFVGPGDPGHGGEPYGDRRDALARASRELSDVLGWPLVADGGSASRLTGSDGNLVTSLESLVRSGILEDVHPDLILRVGQIPTSTSIQEWLGSRRSRSITVDPCGRRQDPARVSEAPLAAHPPETLRELARRVTHRRTPGPWLSTWMTYERRARAALDGATNSGKAWSGGVARGVLDRLPEGGLLHVASSLPIRDLDAFSGAPNRRIHVAANRGANGIDGLISTALGEALAWSGPVVALMGDLAFAHDLGGLAAGRQLLEGRSDTSLTVVVIDNGGGAIFDGLPIAEHPTAHEPRFVTPQLLQATQMAAALQLETSSVAGTRSAVSKALEDILETPGLKVLHVHLDRHLDSAARDQAHERVKRSLDEVPGLHEGTS